jgi:amino acid adenylation domain-containing protein
VVGILLFHGPANVEAVVAAVLAGVAYAPIDPRLPEERRRFMLDHLGIHTLLVDSETESLARRLEETIDWPLTVINIKEAVAADCALAADTLATRAGDDPCYIIMTSGSSGAPKGVVQGRDSVLGAMDFYARRLDITEQDRLLYLSSFSHDGAVEDIFPALLRGSAICPFDLKSLDIQMLGRWIAKQEITVYHSVPTVFRYFIASLAEDDRFPSVRVISMGAETIRPADLQTMARHFPNAYFSHMYGQTESSLNTMVRLDPSLPIDAVPLGVPIPGVQVLLLNEEGEEVEEMETGEMFVASPYLALDYYRNPEATDTAFLLDDELGRIYRTGDLAYYGLDGNLYFRGRKDHQIKIRGFRVEPGEIEQTLQGLNTVAKAVVTQVDGEGDEPRLCAYVVGCEGEELLNIELLKNDLRNQLPDYMVPAYFMVLDAFPVTDNGKLDRQALPKPQTMETGDIVPPANGIQQKLAAVWSDVLRISEQAIGIDSHFFQLGGHSLKATLLAAHIYREFNVNLPLAELFRCPTIRQQELLVRQAEGEHGSPIVPVEKKDYFPLSSAQARLFFLDQAAEQGSGFHMSAALRVAGPLDRARVERAFKRLIRRHEVLRSSYLIVDHEPMQRVWEHVDFLFESCRLSSPPAGGELDLTQVTDESGHPFIRPFDLTRPPLLRIGIVDLGPQDAVLVFDMHHIAGDGASMGILVRDFSALFREEPLPPLNIQYRDYAVWQHKEVQAGHLERCESFWMDLYKEAPNIPRSDFPVDVPRQPGTGVSGASVRKIVPEETAASVRRLGERYDATLYMILLAVLNVVMAKTTGLEDIIIGTAVSGRSRAGLEDVIGMFINILPMRNHPAPGRRFRDFLLEVRERSLEALHYQDMPFDRLVRLLKLKQDPTRHPFYSVSLTVQNYRSSSLELDGVFITPLNVKKQTSNIDINIFAFELEGELQISIQYLSGLFRAGVMERLLNNILATLDTVCRDDSLLIREIRLPADESQQQAAARVEQDLDFFQRLEGEDFNDQF